MIVYRVFVTYPSRRPFVFRTFPYPMLLPPCSLPLSDGRACNVLLDVPIGEAPTGGWPVAYVLDIRQFHVMRAAVDMLPGVLVGVGSARATDRVWDYTPRLVGQPHPPPGMAGRASGLLRVLEEVVRPLVQAVAPIDVCRQVLCGHSLGALFALYVLGHRPRLFQGYVLSSPSLWWGGGYGLRMIRRRLPRVCAADLCLGIHLTAGEYEQGLGPEDAEAPTQERVERLARRRARRMIDHMHELNAYLALCPGLRVRCEVLAGLAHGNASAGSLLPGWRWLLM